MSEKVMTESTSPTLLNDDNAAAVGAASRVEVESGTVPAAQVRARFGWRRFLKNGKAIIGITILLFFALVAVLAPALAPGDPTLFAGRRHEPPSAAHPLGTTGQGQDVFKQLVWGTRVSLGVGFVVGVTTTLLAAIIGLTAAFFGGWVDSVLSSLMNIFVVIPGLPLLVALAAFLPPGTVTIILVLTFTGWAWSARVLRAQALSLRQRDFVAASIVSGESSLRLIFAEIAPNMASIIASVFFGSVIYGIGAQAGLEFLGLGNISNISWGTILYWAGNNAGLLSGAWWTFLPAGLCIALVAFALAMLNNVIDQITNPRLQRR
jgi:peptide/nickel transport system permease protein